LSLKERFRDVVGLTYTAIEIQKVILSVKPEQLPYLKSLPLHPSQRIINEREGKGKLWWSIT
jgi:hypothetical protein